MDAGGGAGRRDSRSGPISLEARSQEGLSAGWGTAQATCRAWRKGRSFQKFGHEVSCSDRWHSGDGQLIIDGARDRDLEGRVCPRHRSTRGTPVPLWGGAHPVHRSHRHGPQEPRAPVRVGAGSVHSSRVLSVASHGTRPRRWSGGDLPRLLRAASTAPGHPDAARRRRRTGHGTDGGDRAPCALCGRGRP